MSLNKSITARLPLCLPPHASDPMPYYIGMLMFGQIFLTFEAATDETSSQYCRSSRDQELIESLRVPSLARSKSILHDLKLLEKRLELLPSCSDTHDGDSEYVTPEDAVRTAAHEYTKHIRENIIQRPHLAMAYAWTMYLALFNGGRWLHRMLAGAGAEFWLEDKEISADNTSTDVEVLSFWHFDAATQEDPGAEKLKLEFKKRFDEASETITADEKDQVVEEAKGVFELCSRLINFLDNHMAEEQIRKTRQVEKSAEKETMSSWSSPTSISVWQGLTSKVMNLSISSWSRSWRREVEVVK